MCLAKDNESPKKEAVSPRSPWSKLLNRQNRPQLPRKVAASARVNLNKCWAKLGELISNSSPKTDFLRIDNEPLLIPFMESFIPVDPVKTFPEEDKENIENLNLLSSNRFEIITEGLEVADNMKNEVREICLSNRHSINCLFCKPCD